MAMVMLYAMMPDLAMRETREVTIFPPGYPQKAPKVPPGRYGMVEMYCDEPGCDCRRVMINVIAEEGRHLATINHAFEPPGPDHWMRDEGQTFLDPINKQSPLSEALLDLFVNVVLADAGYAARLVRHYMMVKEALKDPANPIQQRIAELPGSQTPLKPRLPKKKRWRKPR